MTSLPPAAGVGALSEPPADGSALADALAVLMVDVMSIMGERASLERLERLANRLDERGRTPNGTSAASLLGDVSRALMRMGL